MSELSEITHVYIYIIYIYTYEHLPTISVLRGFDLYPYIHTRWCPSSLAKLVQITPISLWFMADITIVFMVFINQLITGGHHPVWSGDF